MSKKEIGGKLPLIIDSSQGELEDYQVYGKTVENLFDHVSYFTDVATYNQYFSCANIQLSPNTTYTLSTNFHSGTAGTYTQNRETPFIVCNTVDEPRTLTGGFGDDSSASVTTTGDGIIELYVRISRGTNPEELCDLPTLSDFENGKWVMIVEGSTAPTRYVPYGTHNVVGEETENLFNISEYTIGTTTFPTKTLTLEPNTAYTMSSDAPTYNSGALIFLSSAGEGNPTTANNGVYNGHPITKTTDANGKIYVGLRDNGSDYDLSTYKTMLVKGSTAPATFIPFGYKIPILNTSGNLWNGKIEQGAVNTQGYIVDSNERVRSCITGLISGHRYTIRSNLCLRMIYAYNGGWGGIRISNICDTYAEVYEYTFTLPEGADSIGVALYKYGSSTTVPSDVTTAVLVDKSSYDLFIGDSRLGAEEYVDYGEQKVYKQITLSEPLRAIGNYKDTLDLSTGVITRRIKEYTFTGEEQGWVRNETSDHNKDYFKLLLDEFYYGVNDVLMCSHFVQTTISSSASTIGINVYSTQAMGGFGVGLRPNDVSNTSLSDFKTWLALQYANNAPVKLWVVLATAETESVPVTPGLTGTIDGYLIQDSTPTQINPIYPTANDIVFQPIDPPIPLPEISLYEGKNTLTSTEDIKKMIVTYGNENISTVEINNTFYDINDIFARGMIADEYNNNLTYTIGDFCYYCGFLYRCINNCSGNWNSDNWEQTTLANILKGFNITIEEVL